MAHVPAASEGEASMWEHWYHEIQQCGNDMCQRIFVERFKGHEKISAEALFKPSTVRFKGELTSCVLLTLWPLDVKDPKVVETSYYSGRPRAPRTHARCCCNHALVEAHPATAACRVGGDGSFQGGGSRAGGAG